MRVKTWDEPRTPQEHFMGTTRVELTPGEEESLALKTLLQVGVEVLEKRAALDEAVTRLRRIVDSHAEGTHGHVHIPRHLMRVVLGPLHPPAVEQVRDGAQVPQEGVATPEPEPGPLCAQESSGAVEVSHPEPRGHVVVNEADRRGVGHQQHP